MASDPGPAPRIVALEGPSGVGKTRIARELVRRLPGRPLLLLEAFRRLADPPSLEVPTRTELCATESALLREDRRRWREARRARDAGRWVVADTGFVGPLTYCVGLARLDPSRDIVGALASQYGSSGRGADLGWPDLTLVLRAPPRLVARRRATDPAGHPERLALRHEAVGAIEALLWTERLGPVLGDRCRRVDARGTVPLVLRRCLRTIARSPRAAPLSTRGGELLRQRVTDRLAAASRRPRRAPAGPK